MGYCEWNFEEIQKNLGIEIESIFGDLDSEWGKGC